MHIGVLWHIAENNLNYTFRFDRTGKSNTSIESVKGLLLFVYTHNNNKTLCIYKNKENKQSALSATLVLRDLHLETRY